MSWIKASLLIYILLSISPGFARQVASDAVVPRTWNERALADWATPLAHDGIRQHFFSEKEYYQTPVDNYRTYPIYDPNREPPGYWESLKQKKPEPLIDTRKTASSFDWVAAGKNVWEGLDTPALRLFDAESIGLAPILFT